MTFVDSATSLFSSTVANISTTDSREGAYLPKRATDAVDGSGAASQSAYRHRIRLRCLEIGTAISLVK
jgi:hypothetical protein